MELREWVPSEMFARMASSMFDEFSDGAIGVLGLLCTCQNM
jgi:hypothetical protein